MKSHVAFYPVNLGFFSIPETLVDPCITSSDFFLRWTPLFDSCGVLKTVAVYNNME